MAPPSINLLFHPKKKKTNGAAPSPQPSPSKRPRPAAARPPPKKPDDDDDMAALPEGPYTEFKLVSSALNGWKYDVMKFDSRKQVDILKWPAPVKLNRKDLRRSAGAADDGVPQAKAVGPMLGPDGKPVIGMDGRMVMVDAEGRPIHADGSSSTSRQDKGKDKTQPPKKKFQKKTKQVFKIAEEIRQLRKEERYPWVLEDASGSEIWVGAMEEVVKAETQAFFMPASNNTFKFVPAHRWYKFQKKPNHYIPSLEEAETLMARINQNKDPIRWLLKHNGQGPSAATAATIKGEPDDGMTVGQSLAPGGRQLRTVDKGSDALFGDDDEEGGARRRKDNGAEGSYDEMLFAEDFQDDEEKMNVEEEEDDLTKELEERLQREYISANKQREGHIDESDDEEDFELSKAGKALNKLVNKHGDNDDDDDDGLFNPYKNDDEEEEEEEEEAIVTNEPAVMSQPLPSRATPTASRPPSQPAAAPPQPSVPSTSNSRATSPVPTHGGHVVVAKRATSPKAPKPNRLGNGGRATSPLAQSSAVVASAPVRATSPAAFSSQAPNGTSAGSHATSPVAAPLTAPPTATPAAHAAKPSKKRKATDDSAAGQHKNKKSKPHPPPAVGPDGKFLDLEDSAVVDFLREHPSIPTRDCIHNFLPYLHTPQRKAKFTALIKRIAQLKQDSTQLVLRSAYRAPGAGPSK